MKSTTCRGANGQFLEEYHSRAAAEIAAENIMHAGTGRDLSLHAFPESNVKLTPIQCPKCGYWHLRVETSRRQCMFCTDSGLFLKDIYATREEAQRTADHLKKEMRVTLTPYKCPHGSGWHLTKKVR